MPPVGKHESKFDAFMRKYPHTGSKRITHTRIPEPEVGRRGGAYHVPQEHMDEFWTKYHQKVFVEGKNEHLTERQHQQGPAPLLVDIDMHFDCEVDERQHTSEDVMLLIRTYVDVIERLLSFEEGVIMDVYVSQRNDVNRLEKKTKDGIHLVFAIEVDRDVQQLIREDVLQELPAIWGHLPLKNSWEQVIDAGICRGPTNWMVYGSRKPGHEPYVVTQLWRFMHRDGIFGEPVEVADHASFNPKQHLKLMSARYREHPRPSAKETAVTRALEQVSQKKSVKTRAPKAPDTINSREELDIEIDKWLNELSASKPLDYRLRETHLYALALTGKYYGPGSYNDWIRVGWALANTDEKMFLTWLALSSKDNCRNTLSDTSGQFDWSKVPELWSQWCGFDRDNPEGLTYRSIMYWCKTDAPEQYLSIKTSTIDHFIDETICPSVHRANAAAFAKIADLEDGDEKPKGKRPKVQATEFDLAIVLYQLFKDKFVCASIKNNTWYEFMNNRWYEVDNGSSLRYSISRELYTEYFVRHKQRVESEHYLETDDDNKLTKKARVINYEVQRLCEITVQLKTTKQKDNIMREAKELFYDKEFLNKLDHDPYLMCFTNGVVDFTTKTFRKGLPQDYLFRCTNIELVDHTKNKCAESVQMIETFMCQLFPNPDLRRYMWDHLASTLIGTQDNQTFNIYLGSGRNGKSVLVDLMGKVLGDYKGSVPISLITQSRPGIGNTSSEIAQLMGVRYAVMQEPSKGDKINEGIMKEITGGDPIQGRALYKDTVTFIPQFKLVVCTNTLFDIKSNDDGTWRRIRVCDFESKFLDKPYEDELHFPKQQFPHQFQLDKQIDRKFESWAPVFASMLVTRAYQTEGNVADCEAVLSSCNEYRDSQDYIAEFVRDMLAPCEPQKGHQVKKTEVWNVFKDEWWNESGKDGKPEVGMRRELNAFLEHRFGKYASKRGWCNFRIITDEEGESSGTEDKLGQKLTPQDAWMGIKT